MITEVLYSDVSYDFVIGQVIKSSKHTDNPYVCVYIPDLCKGTDWIASLDTFYINDPDQECLLYFERDKMKCENLPHLLPIIGNAKAIWDVIHMKPSKIKMYCTEKNVRHLIESVAKDFGKQIEWTKTSVESGVYKIPVSFSIKNFAYAKNVIDLLSNTSLLYCNIEYIDAHFVNNFSHFKNPPVQTRFFKILRHF